MLIFLLGSLICGNESVSLHHIYYPISSQDTLKQSNSLQYLAAKKYLDNCSSMNHRVLANDCDFESLIPFTLTAKFMSTNLSMHIEFTEPKKSYGTLQYEFKNIQYFRKDRQQSFFANSELVWQVNDDPLLDTFYLMNDLFILRRYYKYTPGSDIIFCDIFNIETKKILPLHFKGLKYFHFSDAKPFILFIWSSEQIIKINCIDGSKKIFNMKHRFLHDMHQTINEREFFVSIHENKGALYTFNMKKMAIGNKVLDRHPIAHNYSGTFFAFLSDEIHDSKKTILVYSSDDFKNPCAELRIPHEIVFSGNPNIQFLNDSFLLIYDSVFFVQNPKIRIYSLELQEEIACYENTLKLESFEMMDDQLVAYTKENGLCKFSFPQLLVFQAYIIVHNRLKQREVPSLRQ